MSFNFVLPPVPRYLRPEDRFAVECQIEALIALLDQEDGDPDREEDDPPGGNVDDERQYCGHYLLLPIYGVDQTAGPLNEVEAYRAHRRAMGCTD
ncbi:hypothetical protein F4U94_14660 [Sphingobium limneticum]|uniref:hypothetical protein n=1 Tax=Sphingobium limneticum TaxID=1007511 RepID=UPI00123E3EE2|nr:hypothetical protein [Sphingobium limneticum]KAA9014073.1 hypothetical protein F4U94_14660 [Sphingobium limneticum]